MKRRQDTPIINLSERNVPLQDPTKLDELLTAMETLHDDLPEFRKATKRAWKGTISALVVGAAAFFVGVGSIVIGLANRNNVDALEKLKDDNVVSICRAINEDVIVNVRAGLVNSLLALAPPGETLTDEQLASVDRYASQVAKEFPLLDCTEKGLKQLRERYANPS